MDIHHLCVAVANSKNSQVQVHIPLKISEIWTKLENVLLVVKIQVMDSWWTILYIKSSKLEWLQGPVHSFPFLSLFSEVQNNFK